MVTRDFSMSGEFVRPARAVDNDAPEALRNELVDVVFHISERHPTSEPTEERLYRVICQSLGFNITANPYGGYRARCSREINRVEWPRVYDLVLRLDREFRGSEALEEYRNGVKELLAAHGIVWDLGDDGRLQRVLPAGAQLQIQAAIEELASPRFAAASAHFRDARDAYDDVPRRERDACANAFDAMESVAKVQHSMPSATFGDVMRAVRQGGAYNPQVMGVLDAVNTLRNKNFGHGMTNSFGLTGAEVDYTYLTCIAGILLFARTP